MNSKQKGKVGEREWRDFLTDSGFPARRGVQYSGSSDSPDVVCKKLKRFHFEVKRNESLNVYAGMDQAINDRGVGKWAVLAHRRNGREWLVTMPAIDWIQLVKSWYEKREERDEKAVD